MAKADDAQIIDWDDWDDANIPTVYLPHRAGGWTSEALEAFRADRRRLNAGVHRTERLVLPVDE